MTTTGKVLQVLRLFTDDRRQLRVAEVATLLEVSSATAYRYMADLEEAGLVERSGLSHYVLGPTIVELDRRIRIHDPLIAASTEIMKALAERTGGTALLSRLHGQKVVCVHQVRGRFGPEQVSYERGRAMSLYRGATSKVILANLSADALRELVRRDADALKNAGLPTRHDALMERLAPLRALRVVATAGEVDRNVMGWAAAVHHGKHLVGSLSLLISKDKPPPSLDRLADTLQRAALRIEGRLDAGTRSSTNTGDKT